MQTEQTTGQEFKAVRRRVAGLPFSSQLAWLIGEAPAALGESGVLGSTIATLERGGGHGFPQEGSPGGTAYHEGVWLDRVYRGGDGARWRYLIGRWRRFGAKHRTTALAYYSPAPRHPCVTVSGYASPVPIGDRLQFRCGELAGVVFVVAVLEEAKKRHETATAKFKKALAELDSARAAANDATPHVLADLDEIRGALVRGLHGAAPRGLRQVRLEAISALREVFAADGAAVAASRYRDALVAVADAQALLVDSPIALDTRPIVRMVERDEQKPLGVLKRTALQWVRDAHDAWDEL